VALCREKGGVPDRNQLLKLFRDSALKNVVERLVPISTLRSEEVATRKKVARLQQKRGQLEADLQTAKTHLTSAEESLQSTRDPAQSAEPLPPPAPEPQVSIAWHLSGVWMIAASRLRDFAAHSERDLVWTVDVCDHDGNHVARLAVQKLAWQAVDEAGQVVREFEGPAAAKEEDGEGPKDNGQAEEDAGGEPS
jgi:hypothetical protein